MPAAAPTPSDKQRRIHLLNTAMEVFLRYGFKKTSMGDVAAEAKLSRQGLYLHFSTKEELFRATLEHSLESSRAGVAEALAKKKLPLEERLLEVFEITIGRYVGKVGAEAYDLSEALSSLAGDSFDQAMEDLKKLLGKVLREETLKDLSATKEVTAEDRIEVLFAAACGMKHCVKTREEFREGMTLAIRVALSPLRLKA